MWCVEINAIVVKIFKIKFPLVWALFSPNAMPNLQITEAINEYFDYFWIFYFNV